MQEEVGREVGTHHVRRNLQAPALCFYILLEFYNKEMKKRSWMVLTSGFWREVTPAQQRLCLKIPSQDLTVSINRWTPWAWRRGRGSGRKLYLTVITIWHLPELHIRTSPAGCPDPPACANEAAVNRILLAPTVAIPRPSGGPKNISPAHAPCHPQRGGR